MLVCGSVRGDFGVTDEAFVGTVDDDGHTIGASLLIPNGREHMYDESTNQPKPMPQVRPQQPSSKMSIASLLN